MKNLFRKAVNKILLPHSQLAYAQSGEDLILAHIFYKLNIPKPSYLDIGANHPSFISNTYYFYLRGSRGVCIEPNPHLFRQIKKIRPGDIVLNAGVGINESSEADFYLFHAKADGLSTFSKIEADYWGEVGMKGIGKIRYEKVIKMPLITINTIIEKHFDKTPDFISLDVEGLDLDILSSLDYNLYSPKVICVETVVAGSNGDDEMTDFLTTKGYKLFSKTPINNIFVLEFVNVFFCVYI